MSDVDLFVENVTARGDARWFSANPGKAWSERWFLLYSPCWMLAMGLVMLSGLDERLGDVGFVVPDVVGLDAETDLALLKVDSGSLQAIRLGSSRELRIGDVVLAIYGPFNYGGRYTSESNARFDQWLAAQHPKKAKRSAVVQVRIYAQDAETGEILMVANMNEESLARTLVARL